MKEEKNKKILEAENILEAANKSGFNLEFITKRILDNADLVCEQNKYMSLRDNVIELDIYAYSHHEYLRLCIECKGTSTKNHLILIQAPSNKLKAYQGSGNRYTIANKEKKADYKLPVFDVDGTKAPLVYTGDFYQASYKKCSQNTESNNLYKAQQQIVEAMEAINLQEHTRKDVDGHNIQSTVPYALVPIIVTNAQIWIVDYNKPERLPFQSKGAIMATAIHSTDIIFTPPNSGGKVANEIGIPIINVNYLNECINIIKSFNVNRPQKIAFNFF